MRESKGKEEAALLRRSRVIVAVGTWRALAAGGRQLKAGDVEFHDKIER